MTGVWPYMAGNSATVVTGWWISYVRIDIEGNVLAEFLVYPTTIGEYLVSMSLLDDGIVFAGAISETDSTLLIKKSFNGDLIWTSSLPTMGGVVEVQQDADGNFILLVEVDDYDYEIVKADPNGCLLYTSPSPRD